MYLTESGNIDVINAFKKCKTKIKTELSKLKILAKKGDPDDKDKVNTAVDECHKLIDESYKIINSVKIGKGDNSIAFSIQLMKKMALLFGPDMAIEKLTKIVAPKIISRLPDDKKKELFDSMSAYPAPAEGSVVDVFGKTLQVAGATYAGAKLYSKNKTEGKKRELEGMNAIDAYNLYKQKYSKLINKFHEKVNGYKKIYEKNCKHHKKK
jgi:hypothetical protein